MKIKKFILTCSLASVMMASGIANADCKDNYWSFTNYSGTATTAYKHKDTNGNVYCSVGNAAKEATIYVTVGKANNSKGNGQQAASKKVKLTAGNKYTIVNSVGKNKYARLRFNAVIVNSSKYSGYWSPDASREYNIIG